MVEVNRDWGSIIKTIMWEEEEAAARYKAEKSPLGTSTKIPGKPIVGI